MPSVLEAIDEQRILSLLDLATAPSEEAVLAILAKAGERKGLELEEVAVLLSVKDPALIQKMFETAHRIKQEIYGERIVFFAPLYISNFCVNDCDYCGFHKRNTALRKKLTLDEVAEQTRLLIRMGHKRLLLEFGEDPVNNPIDYVTDVIRTIYSVKEGNGEIRRVNVNIAATSVEDFRKLKAAGIGTYQLFQETYHRETYEKLHHGPKADYERQLFAHNRAFEAGLDDLGIGALFGLYDYRFETLALVSHTKYMEKTFGVGPHTISVPRLQPAPTVNMEMPYRVSEEDLLKIIAILRMAVPYTGMILSTRERQEVREKAFEIGISQTSAGSRTSPGGYGQKNELRQFSVADNRCLDEVVLGIMEQGKLPSFCTACYRKGRTGEAFMDLAKPGNIHHLCRPNAIMTFKEYLEDYATPQVKVTGIKIINRYLEEIEDLERREETKKRLTRIERGERDLHF